jgi:hypothetical protein
MLLFDLNRISLFLTFNDALFNCIFTLMDSHTAKFVIKIFT